MSRRALVTGITGQDGSYLCEYLLGLGYEVHGTVRPSTAAVEETPIGPLLAGDEPRLTLHVTDLSDATSLTRLIEAVAPAEIYNLAAQSHVGASFAQPVTTGDITGLGTVRLLEAIRHVDQSIRFYQAGSSEMFGYSHPPQSEQTPFHPRSPYAVAKCYAYWSTVNYRESYGLHASNGILFNHESPRRGRNFVTRKITRAIPRLLHGDLKVLRLGNLDVRRDWGHARDYVEAMHAIITHPEPLDLAIGTGTSHTLRDFLDVAFRVVDLDWRDHVQIDPALYRPADVPAIECDPRKAHSTLGWRPKTSFPELVAEMVEADVAAYRQR